MPPVTYLLCLLSLQRRVEGDPRNSYGCSQASLGADLVAWKRRASKFMGEVTLGRVEEEMLPLAPSTNPEHSNVPTKKVNIARREVCLSPPKTMMENPMTKTL